MVIVILALWFVLLLALNFMGVFEARGHSQGDLK